MTETERLILEGLRIMMQTQVMPRGEGALETHCSKLSKDMGLWEAALIALDKKQ